MTESARAKTPPLDRSGRILWRKIAGFKEWFRDFAPSHTNLEIVEALRERYGAEVSQNQVHNMRQVYRTPITTDTLRRAFEKRNVRFKGASVEKEQKKESASERLDRNMLVQKIKALSTKQTFFEVVGQAVLDAVREIGDLPSPKPVPLPPKAKPGHEDAVLLISDVQAGQRVDNRESGGLGHFNLEVLQQEILYLQGAIDRIRQHHLDCRTLHVAFLGDIVEGVAIFPGQMRQVDLGVVRQVMFSVEHFARFLHFLASRFPEVRCYGVVGNHGRVGGRPGEFSPLDNFDYLVYRWLEERLRPVRHVTWDIAESWWKIATVQGWRFLLNHGEDTGPAWAGIPFYGASRMKARYRETIRTACRVTGLTEEDFDYICIGHHHEAANFLSIFMNGNWPGGSEFSLKRLQMGSIPVQWMFGVHRDHGVTWQRAVNLRPLFPVEERAVTLLEQGQRLSVKAA